MVLSGTVPRSASCTEYSSQLISENYFNTFVIEKLGGQWQILHLHLSKIPEKISLPPAETDPEEIAPEETDTDTHELIIPKQVEVDSPSIREQSTNEIQLIDTTAVDTVKEE